VLLERLRRLAELAILGVPVMLINAGVAWIGKPLIDQPWRALLFIVPLAAVALIFRRYAVRGGSLRVRGWLLGFLVAYLCAFSVAAGTRVLDWKHESWTLSAAQAPRRWIAPASWGDWHYWFAPREEPVSDPLVITVKPPRTVDEGRFQVTQQIRIAANAGARGIAFDYHFSGDASGVDTFLCQVLKSTDIPVIAGVRVIRPRGRRELFGEAYPDSIERCWLHERRGHLHGSRDRDGVVRNVVLRIDIPDSVALSVRVAREMTGSTDLRADPVLQFLEPKLPIEPVAWDSLLEMETQLQNGLIRGRFLLVGEDSPQETFHTPFGDRLGVQIHAAAIANLVSGRWIKRTNWTSSLFFILGTCYLMTALVAQGVPARRLVLIVAGMSAFLFICAALGMRIWLIWLDVVYPTVAVWLLLAILVSLRRRFRLEAPARRSGAEQSA
jgi:CHASE2 domain-containing sensor protein